MAVVVGARPLAPEPAVLLERDDLAVSAQQLDGSVQASVVRGSASWDFVADGSTMYSDDAATVVVSTYDAFALAQAVFMEPPRQGVVTHTGECLEGARAIGFQIPDLVRLDLVYGSDGLDVRIRHAADLAVVLESEGGFYAREAVTQTPLAELALTAFSHQFACQLRDSNDGSVTYVDVLLSSVRIARHGIVRFVSRGGIR